MTLAGWILLVGGGAWMLVSVFRYRWGDPLDVWGESMALDVRWLGGAVVALVGARLAVGVGGWILALLLVVAWLVLIPLKMVVGRSR